ncbi:acyl-CoA dehydrogenase, partial [Streptomyces sp. SID7958]|nr:acyl-CoA dehydrogenase [Streptomyces sp. SID7958]
RLLARTHTRLKALRLLSRRMVAAVEDGTLTPQEASAAAKCSRAARGAAAGQPGRADRRGGLKRVRPA